MSVTSAARSRASDRETHNDHVVRLSHGKKLKCVCAATLVYTVAPYPAVNDVMFDMVLLDQADRVRESASQQGWFSRAWNGVKSYAQSQVVAQRQASFLHHFSRQLEMNAEESHVVLVSVRCAVLSMGNPQCGMLYATNCGLYFCADGVAMIEDTTVEPEVPRDWDAVSTSSSVESHVIHDALIEGREPIKDRIMLSDVASILPSVVLPTRDDSAPFLQGIPSAFVHATALQLFMAGQTRQIFQFLGFSDIVVRPPGTSVATNKAAPARPEAPVRVDEVVKTSEVELLAALPPHLACLQFTSLLERLWMKRLERLGQPLVNPTVPYAAPH